MKLKVHLLFTLCLLFSFNSYSQERKSGLNPAMYQDSVLKSKNFRQFLNCVDLPEGIWINTSRPDVYSNEDRKYLFEFWNFDRIESFRNLLGIELGIDGLGNTDAISIYLPHYGEEVDVEYLKHFSLINGLRSPMKIARNDDSCLLNRKAGYGTVIVQEHFAFQNYLPDSVYPSEYLSKNTDLISRISEVYGKNTFKNRAKVGSEQFTKPIGVLHYPSAIATDPEGERIWVWSAPESQIYQMKFNGEITDVIGSGAPGYHDAKFQKSKIGAVGELKYDAQNDLLYILDRQNATIRVANFKKGEIQTIIGNGTFGSTPLPDQLSSKDSLGLLMPYSMALFEGDIYFSLIDDHSVWKYDPLKKKAERYLGTGEPGQADGKRKKAGLRNPMGIAFNSEGELFFTEFGSGKLRKFDGKRIETLSGEGEWGLNHQLLCHSDSIMLVDDKSGSISRFTNVDGFRKMEFSDDGLPLNRPMQLSFSRGLAFIVDAGNQCIRVYDKDSKSLEILKVAPTPIWQNTRETHQGIETQEIITPISLSEGTNIIEFELAIPEFYSVVDTLPQSVTMMPNEFSKKIDHSVSSGYAIFETESALTNVGLSFELSFYYTPADHPELIYYRTSRITLPFVPAEEGKETSESHNIIYRPLDFD